GLGELSPCIAELRADGRDRFARQCPSGAPFRGGVSRELRLALPHRVELLLRLPQPAPDLAEAVANFDKQLLGVAQRPVRSPPRLGTKPPAAADSRNTEQ